MKNLERTLLLGLLFTSVFLNPALRAFGHAGGHANAPASVKITSPKTTIDMGEPLILKLTYEFKQPQINGETGDVFTSIRHSSCPLVELKDADNDWLKSLDEFSPLEKEGIKYFPLGFPSLPLDVQDEQGLEYSGYFLVSYSLHKSRWPLSKGLSFDEPGKYRICTISTANKIFSNAIEIRITSQAEQEECALLDPNVCDFLMGIDRVSFKDENYRSRIMVNLKNIVERCPDSILPKLASVRLGLESYRADERERTKARREKREPSWPLYEEAVKYFQKGLQLPDDFSIRQQLLYSLTEIEARKNNFAKALSYANELGVKYPRGKYGKQAPEIKAELQELQKLVQQDSEETQRRQTSDMGERRDWRVWLSVSVGGVAVVALIAGLLLIRKKGTAGGE